MMFNFINVKLTSNKKHKSQSTIKDLDYKVQIKPSITFLHFIINFFYFKAFTYGQAVVKENDSLTWSQLIVFLVNLRIDLELHDLT